MSESDSDSEDDAAGGFAQQADPNAGEPRTWAAVAHFLEDEAKARILQQTQVDTAAAAEASSDGDFDEDEEHTDALGILPRTAVAQIMQQHTATDVAAQLRLGSGSFDPARYLGTLHQRTPFAALGTRGVAHLQRRLSSKAKAIKGLVRANFELFIRSKDTVDMMHAVVLEHELLGERGGGSAMLGASYAALEADAQRVFEVLLARKAEADHIRTLLFALDRSKFLFRMPATLRAAVARADDEKVLLVHARAHELLGDTKNELFRRVLSECDTVVDAYRKQLFRILEDPAARVSDVERVIGILGQLGMTAGAAAAAPPACDNDPVRYYLAFHVARLRQLLTDAEAEYQRLRSDEEQQLSQKKKSGRKAAFIRGAADALLRWVPSLYGLVAMFAAAPELSSSAGAAEGGSEGSNAFVAATVTARHRHAVGRIPDILGRHLRAQKQRPIRVQVEDGTWVTIKVHRTLTAAVLFQQMMDRVRAGGAPRARDIDYELDAVVKHKKGKEETTELRPYDRPYAIHKKWSKAEGSYFAFRRRMPDEKPLSSSSSPLATIPAPEQKAVSITREFVVESILSVITLFTEETTRVFEEDSEPCSSWTDPDDRTPIEADEALLHCVKELSRSISELLAQGTPERIVDPITKSLAKWKKQLVARICAECVNAAGTITSSEENQLIGVPHTDLPAAFSMVVRELLRIADAIILPEDSKLRETVVEATTNAVAAFVDTLHSLAFSEPLTEGDAGTFLLRILANCVYCKRETFPDILGVFPNSEARIKRASELLDDLEELICQRYLRQHTVLADSLVHSAICDEAETWFDPPQPDRVPDFALTFLLELTKMHSDLHAFAPRFSRRLLQKTLVSFTQSVRDAAVELPALGYSGALHILSGAEFVQATMQAFATERSGAALDQLRDTLAALVASNPEDSHTSTHIVLKQRHKSQRNVLDTREVSALVTRIVEEARRGTAGLFACFRIADDDMPPAEPVLELFQQ